MFWMNVDTVFKKCVVHREECPWVDWVRNEGSPEFKGINELKRDGGWFSFDSIEEVESDYRQNWEPRDYILSRAKCIISNVKWQGPKARRLPPPDLQEKALAIAQRLVQIYTQHKLPRYFETFYKPLGFTKEEMAGDPNKIYSMIVLAAYDRQPFTRVARGWEAIWGTKHEIDSICAMLNEVGLLNMEAVSDLSIDEIRNRLRQKRFYGYRIDSDGANTDYARTIEDAADVVRHRQLLELMIKADTPEQVEVIFRLLDSIHGIGPTIASKLVMYTLREIGIGQIAPDALYPAVAPILKEYHNTKLVKEVEQAYGAGFVSTIFECLKKLGDPFAIDALYYIDREEPLLKKQIFQAGRY